MIISKDEYIYLEMTINNFKRSIYLFRDEFTRDEYFPLWLAICRRAQYMSPDFDGRTDEHFSTPLDHHGGILLKESCSTNDNIQDKNIIFLPVIIIALVMSKTNVEECCEN